MKRKRKLSLGILFFSLCIAFATFFIVLFLMRVSDFEKSTIHIGRFIDCVLVETETRIQFKEWKKRVLDSPDDLRGFLVAYKLPSRGYYKINFFGMDSEQEILWIFDFEVPKKKGFSLSMESFFLQEDTGEFSLEATYIQNYSIVRNIILIAIGFSSLTLLCVCIGLRSREKNRS